MVKIYYKLLFMKRKGSSLAAFITAFILVISYFLPAVFLGTQQGDEIQEHKNQMLLFDQSSEFDYQTLSNLEPDLSQYFEYNVNNLKANSKNGKNNLLLSKKVNVIKQQPIAAVWNDDELNIVYGMKSGMEYSLNGASYIVYNNKVFQKIDFSGNHILDVRYAAKGNTIAGPVTQLVFTENIPVTPPAPDVWHDDMYNKVYGMSVGMEYSLDGGTYVAYSIPVFNQINFSGNHTLYVRYAATGVNPYGPDTILVFTYEAPVVTHDDENNIIYGMTTLMEYSTDGENYTAYDPLLFQNDFPGDQTVYVRYMSEGSYPPSDNTVLVFTENPVKPDPPAVTHDDELNVINGMTILMEYSTDGENYIAYDPEQFQNNFSGDQTVYVRYSAQGVHPVSEPTVLIFTENPVEPDPPAEKAKILFTFDDGWASQYEHAYHILESAGFNGTIYVCRDIVNGTHPDMLRLTDLQVMYQNGWDIANHTTNHQEIGDHTDEASLNILRSLYLDNQQWIATRIGPRGAHHVAYPSGLFSQELIEVIKNLGVMTGRRANEEGYEAGQLVNSEQYYKLFIQPLETDWDGLEIALESIDYAIDNQATVIFMIHKVEPVSGDLVLTNNNLQTIVEYVKLLVDGGKAEVMTISEWYEASRPITMPTAPKLTVNDETNQIAGMTSEMEYNLNGSGWLMWQEGNILNLDGSNIIQVRYASQDDMPAGQITVLKFTPEPGMGKIIFTFDDGWKSQVDQVLPVLQKAGYQATAYINRDNVSWDPNNLFLDIDELQSLYDAGWDLSNHTTNHANLIETAWGGLIYNNPEMWNVNYLENQNWLLSNEWTRGAYHVNYPDGLYNNELIDYLKSIGVSTARTIDPGMQSSYELTTDEAYRLKVVSIDNSDPYYLQKARNAILDAYYEGLTVIFVFHKVEADITIDTLYPGITVKTSDFTDLVQYVKTYTNRNDLTVMTISQWYELFQP